MSENTSPDRPHAPAFSPALKAFCIPFVAFMLLLPVPGWLAKLGREEFFFAQAKYWVFPLQTVVCAVLLGMFWSAYRWDWPRRAGGWLLTIGIAVLVLVLWISPQEWLGFAPRLEGFDPNIFPKGTPEYWGSLILRFMRLVIVVPLVEEIFWRGFLLRYLIREDFEKIPFGTYSTFSFVAVSIAFALAHMGPDFVPALLTGALYNLIAIRTRSLGACVVAHAITNLLLGLYIMKTGQYGFW